MSGLSLDHVGIAVADLDKAAAQFQRLGFQLTPRGYHTLPPPSPGAPRPLVGTGNNCAMLRRGYLELIGVTDPVYQGRLRADIARYEGLHVIAFGSEDAAATAGALRQAGARGDGPAAPGAAHRGAGPDQAGQIRDRGFRGPGFARGAFLRHPPRHAGSALEA